MLNNLFSHSKRYFGLVTIYLLIAQSFSPACTAATADIPSVDEQLKQLQQSDAFKTAQLIALEQKVQRLETILTAFMDERSNNIQDNHLNLLRDIGSIKGLSNKASVIMSHTLRTCSEARAVDPLLDSGMYWIDPDGQGVGDDPIYVYCDMTTGTTSITHDNEIETDIGHCEEPGCYSKTINYSASIRQVKALVELSDTCHQSIMYNCISAPFELDGVSFNWWNDKYGKQQYFWAGNNGGVHTCQCGLERNCVDSSKKCNCDAMLSVPVTDSGNITDKNHLPITRVNFGMTHIGAGIYALGRLECAGRATVQGMPKSCSDLWKMGYSLNGFYPVRGENHVEIAYCDFSKLPDETGFQKWIGLVDVKTSSVYFQVIKTGSVTAVGVPITLYSEIQNAGNALNSQTGIFTAPRQGVYSFAFAAVALLESNTFVTINFLMNGEIVNVGHAHGSSGQHDQTSIHTTLHLQAGDRIWVQIGGPANSMLVGGWIHFTGWQLQEELTF